VRGHSPAGFIVDVQVADTASSSTTSTATPSSSDDADDGATTESQEEHCAPPGTPCAGPEPRCCLALTPSPVRSDHNQRCGEVAQAHHRPLAICR
jgi:hypothetical protein